MILLIKADKRPKKCGECKGWYKCEGWEKEPYTCPIVGELPDKHGRLVDAVDIIRELAVTTLSPDTYDLIVHVLNKVPTILESSKE